VTHLPLLSTDPARRARWTEAFLVWCPRTTTAPSRCDASG